MEDSDLITQANEKIVMVFLSMIIVVFVLSVIAYIVTREKKNK